MSMPLLVRLSDSEIEMAEMVIAQFANGFDDAGRVREQMRAARLAIDQKASLSDLDVEPVHRDVQPAGKLLSAEDIGWVLPARSLLGLFDAGAQADALHRDRQDLFRAIR
jgi:hypothetical protein